MYIEGHIDFIDDRRLIYLPAFCRFDRGNHNSIDYATNLDYNKTGCKKHTGKTCSALISKLNFTEVLVLCPFLH